MEISQNFVAFLEYMNFKSSIYVYYLGNEQYCIAGPDSLNQSKFHHDLPQQVWFLFWFWFRLHKSQGMLNTFPSLTMYNSLKQSD